MMDNRNNHKVHLRATTSKAARGTDEAEGCGGIVRKHPTYKFPTKAMSQRQMTSNVRKLPVTYDVVATPIRSNNA
eukprot:scaffold15937_cov141-Skeletonema_marinoi.AAC.12